MAHHDADWLDRFLEFVEWQLVREQVAARTSSSPGSFRARELRPGLDLAEAQRLQARTAAALPLVADQGAPDLERVVDVDDLYRRLARAERGPGARELRWLAQTLEAGLAARLALQGSPSLLDLVTDPGDDPAGQALDEALARDVLAAIGAYGVVKSEASEALAGARAELQGARERLRRAVERLAQDGALLLALSEPATGEHEGIVCLRVRPDHARRVAGVIRGAARDGALLVEPEAAQEHYSLVRELAAAEFAEARRVVAALAARALPRRAAHVRLAAGLIQVDVHLALARHALDLELTPPRLAPDLRADLRAARHPLLPRDACVPISLALGGERRLLVISGPNGGGKTAAMKTLGLAAVLAYCGGHVPAAAGALVPRISRLVAVAAPRSSVTAGVSQFQAHARDLAAALAAVRPGSLVLLDEIGQGTDAGEAAALAQAVLEHLLGQDVLVLATTHLAPLKAFAERTPGAANASVDLDAGGRPTFVLTVGRAGRSFALEVARAHGLPPAICDRAEALHRGEAAPTPSGAGAGVGVGVVESSA